jgi:hypothetical protein
MSLVIPQVRSAVEICTRKTRMQASMSQKRPAHRGTDPAITPKHAAKATAEGDESELRTL